MPPTSVLTDYQKRFIAENCREMSDEHIGDKIGLSRKQVARFRRKKLNLEKTRGGRLVVETEEEVELAPVDGSDLQASASMTEHERKAFFQYELKNTIFYETLREQLTDKEMKFYLEEWASLCVQFEDIVATEKRQIDEYIKCQIMENRLLRNIRITEDEINNLVTEVEKTRLNTDMESDVEARIRDEELVTLIRGMAAQSQVMATDHQKIIKTKNDLLETLHGRRKDRIAQITSSKTTFAGLVEALREQEIREAQGRLAHLLKTSKDKKLGEWRDEQMFPDGSTDVFLHDSETPVANTTKSSQAIEKLLVKDHTKEKATDVDKDSVVKLGTK